MTPRNHEMKLNANYFDAVLSGEKSFEVRRDDRGFQRGDVVILRKWGYDDVFRSCRYLDRHVGAAIDNEDTHTIRAIISYVLTGGQHGIEPGYVVLGLAEITEL